MTTSRNSTPLRLRLIGFLLGGCFLFWAPFEDSITLFPIIFAIAIASWMAVFFVVKSKFLRHKPILQYTFTGLVAGLAIAPLTLLLMAFKTGLHGHQNPDFNPQQALAVLYRTPVWLMGGLLVGLGLSLLTTRN